MYMIDVIIVYVISADVQTNQQTNKQMQKMSCNLGTSQPEVKHMEGW